MMLDDFVKQASRLFSSKSNRSKLVHNPINRLHYYKQIIIAIALVFLIGYSKFRDDFDCQKYGQIPKNTFINLCWVNGTSTIVQKNTNPNAQQQQTNSNQNKISRSRARIASSSIKSPHVGIQFNINDENYELIDHNYMRSLWLLTLVIGLCSFVAQRYWSRIFNNETLIGLLKLPGHNDLPVVKRVDSLKPYNKLVKLETVTNNDSCKQLRNIDILQLSEDNEYDKSLEYYANQLVYLLLPRRTCAYKLSTVKLRRKYVRYSLLSLALTSLQFAIPCFVLGDKYYTYGWRYLQALIEYVAQHVLGRRPQETSGGGADGGARFEPVAKNTVDYAISAELFPIQVLCRYNQFGSLGTDLMHVQCTAALMEIYAKIYFVLWWTVLIDLGLEVWLLVKMLALHMRYSTTRNSFASNCWPNTKKEADFIANFRHLVAMARRKAQLRASDHENHHNEHENEISEPDDVSDDIRKSTKRPLMSERQRKHLEAQISATGSAKRALGSFAWPFGGHSARESHTSILIADRCTDERDKSELVFIGTSYDAQVGNREKPKDINLLYLLRLLYMRLNCNSRKVEEVIRATHRALATYLNHLDELEKPLLLADDQQSYATPRTSSGTGSGTPEAIIRSDQDVIQNNINVNNLGGHQENLASAASSL